MTGENLRIPVTTIENFRYITSQDDDDKRDNMLQEFVFGLSSRIPATRKMEVGSAFGTIIQKPQMYYNSDSDVFQCNGYEFPKETITEATRIIDYRALFEVPCEKTYDDVTVTGRLDAWLGTKVIDFKTKLVPKGLSKYDTDELFEKYNESLQWMFYTDMADVDQFTYQVYVMQEDTFELLDIVTINAERSAMVLPKMYYALNSLVRFIKVGALESYFMKGHAAKEEVLV